MATGSAFAYFTFTRRKWWYKTMTTIVFLAIIGCLMILYFSVDCNLPKESLIGSLFLPNFGYIIIAIYFITALSRVPFLNFFKAVSAQVFVSTAFGGTLGTALLGCRLNVTITKNAMLLSSPLDPLPNHLLFERIYGVLQQ